MKLLPAVVLLLMCQAALAGERNDLQLLKLQGRVKRTVSVSYSLDTDKVMAPAIRTETDTSIFNEAGNRVLRTGSFPDAEQSYRQVFRYDTTGTRLLSDVAYDLSGGIDEATYYVYDSAGNELQATQRNSPDDDGTWTNYRYSYIYDTTGRVMQGFLSYGQNDTSFTKPYMTHKNFFDGTGTKHRQENYNSDGMLTYTAICDSERCRSYLYPDYRVDNQFDSQGNCISSTNTKNDGTIAREERCAYDRHGNLLSRKVVVNGKPKPNQTYTYEQTDRQGNWQKMTTYINGKRTGYTQRKIEYYKVVPSVGSIDRKMVYYLSKIEKWNDSSHQSVSNAEDSLCFYNDRFQNYLCKILTEQPLTLAHSFPLATNNGLGIVTAEDGRLRVYTWHQTGDVVRSYASVMQYNTTKGVFARKIYPLHGMCVSYEKDTGEPVVYKALHAVKDKDSNTVYIATGHVHLAANYMWYSVKAFTIRDDKLNDSIRFFHNGKALVNAVGYDFSYENCKEPEVAIHFSKDKKTLYLPVTVNERPTGHYLIYKFNGRNFVLTNKEK